MLTVLKFFLFYAYGVVLRIVFQGQIATKQPIAIFLPYL